MMKRLVSPRPGTSRTLPKIGALIAERYHVLAQNTGAGAVPPTVTAWALRTRMSFATGVPRSRVVSRN